MTSQQEPDRSLLTMRIIFEHDDDTDYEWIDRAARNLRSELNELDVESVSSGSDTFAPSGSKGADPATVESLIVVLSASGGVLPTALAMIKDWLDRSSRSHRISVKIGEDAIELAHASQEEQDRLVNAFVQRHAEV